MYQSLLFSHSIVRWLVLITLIYSIYRAFRGYFQNLQFSRLDNLVRHWTATIAHIQLIIGIILYSQSPIIKYFWANFGEAINNIETTFYGLLHIILMLSGIVLITIGSALAKRKATDTEKFRTILMWFLIALFIIFIAIPWPFSPLSNRPYIR
ncbi:hypothetical protein D9O36_05325 [Zobellia amurskyensis]|uniref:Cytochrome B n=1 Tax=Zobellia amurskyensis TaxID=248905 RepID=A0A7X3D0M2_9FLAO|nr:hypothetical protein [Zobellia amurskyensis]MUH35254.1 hypothetical protein [Zobellia amurskyensis]